MRGLFRPLEEYAGPSVLTESFLSFVSFLGSPSESAGPPVVARDISAVVCTSELYYL
jgi:hypothetical protein